MNSNLRSFLIVILAATQTVQSLRSGHTTAALVWGLVAAALVIVNVIVCRRVMAV